MFDMMQTGTHQASRLAEVGALLDSIGLDTYANLAVSEQVAACETLARIEARVKAHQLAAARAADESSAPKSVGATSTGAMLANSFGGDPAAGSRLVKQPRNSKPSRLPRKRSPAVRSR